MNLIIIWLLIVVLTPLLANTFATSRPLSPPPETSTGEPPPPPVVAEPPFQRAAYTPFKPSIAVIVGILTTLFSVTFLLLMYAKHCKGTASSRGGERNGDTVGYYYYHGRGLPVSGRKNSGIDPVVIESLPVFRFGSLRGQKEGLECAVCLSRFEPAEVLRLLPKCKHAFHVECIDTWLDAHSTCPLCRFRVDPEDILLVDRYPVEPEPDNPSLPAESTHRVSGRHSSAGERGAVSSFNAKAASCRRSCDVSSVGTHHNVISAVHRKDGLLMSTVDKATSEKTMRKHRIIISTDPVGPHQRWSDVQPSDLFYLRSQMLINESRRSSSSSTTSNCAKVQGNQRRVRLQGINGRNVINERSVSEITGLSRLPEGEGGGGRGGSRREERERERQYIKNGAVSRWMAWISQSSSTTPAAAQVT